VPSQTPDSLWSSPPIILSFHPIPGPETVSYHSVHQISSPTPAPSRAAAAAPTPTIGIRQELLPPLPI
jgi:hypothetical protein